VPASSSSQSDPSGTASRERPRTPLGRAAPLFRLPGSSAVPEPTADRSGLRDPESGRCFPVERGVLDLLGDGFAPTLTQRSLDTRPTAWLYDRFRDVFAPRVGMPRFADEADQVASRLALAAGDVVLDVACGHGNFTVELARRVGPEGLVIGLDISRAMLARAARRVARSHLDNVLLVRGDALALPFADAAFAAVNCSGGIHQIPDLPRALAQMARVSAPGAGLSASGFAVPGEEPDGLRGWLRARIALHFVPLARLERQLHEAGFEAVGTRMAGPALGFGWGRRAAQR
jgi:ubiquinone/menaquinone biosynthesis C-methylase UbiE